MKNTSYEPKKWTTQAIYCYLRGCVCEGCLYNINLESINNCQTKFSVIELVRLKGLPKENLLLEAKGLRRCSCCKKIKKLEEFHNTSVMYGCPYCKECYKEKCKEYKKRRKSKN